MVNERESLDVQAYVPFNLKFSIMLTTCFVTVSGAIAIQYAVYVLYTTILPTRIVSFYLILPFLALILVGIFLPIFAFIGCRGAIREEMNLLRECCFGMHICMLIALIVGSYSAAVYFVVSESGDRSMFSLKEAIVNYHDDLSLAEQIDNVQRVVKCCGVGGKLDWNKNSEFMCNYLNTHSQRCNVPSSCCVSHLTKVAPSNCGFMALDMSGSKQRGRKNFIYSSGCKRKFDVFLFNTTLDIVFIFAYFLLCELLVWRLSMSVISVYKRRHLDERHSQIILQNFSHVTSEV